MPSTKAVLYLRSSKDRHDVSIDAQRGELKRLAADRKIEIVGEFSDVVMSGADEDRPGFQRLYEALRARDRAWSLILVLDTSRLARRIAAAYWFEDRECKPRGVDLIYKNLPEMDAAERALVKAVFHGVDEWHSLVSKRKGLAGMRQNIEAGHRAGGRAPHGYRLIHTATGVLRDGQPVTKSHLEPDLIAPAVGIYLRLRAAGLRRKSALRSSGLSLPDTSLIGMEWNALTYAGCTVWNVHAERLAGKAIGGSKRRPRTDWIIKEGTHKPLITREEAEALLRRIEVSGQPWRDRAPADYLLSGLLRTPADEKWEGCRDRQKRYYRRGRRVDAESVERAVLAKIGQDLKSERFVASLIKAARQLAQSDTQIQALERAWTAIETLDRKIAKVTAMLPDGPQRPLLEQIRKWEDERAKARAGTIDLESRLSQARAIAHITERDVLRLLDELAGNMAGLDPAALRDFLRTIIDRIIMDPATLTCRIHYEIAAVSGDKLASPRRSADIPTLTAWTILRLAA
jgi:site-specific DNA recombinase